MENFQDVRIFASGRINTDVDRRYAKENEYISLLNGVIGADDNGGGECVKNLKGTTSVFDLPLNAGFFDYYIVTRHDIVIQNYNSIPTNPSTFSITTDGGVYYVRFYYTNSTINSVQIRYPSDILWRSYLTTPYFIITFTNSAITIANLVGIVTPFDFQAGVSWQQTVGLGSVATYSCVGTLSDVGRGAIVYFVRDTGGANHGIFRMFLDSKKCEWILRNQSILNFQEDFPVSANILEDLLYWTDGYEGTPFVDYNPPCKINTVKAIGLTRVGLPVTQTTMVYKGEIHIGYGKCYRYINSTPTQIAAHGFAETDYWELANTQYYSVINRQVLDRIKYPPMYAPGVAYNTDQSQKVNKLRNHLYQSVYRYTYDDNEKSVWSDISDLPIPGIVEYVNGTFDESVIHDNVIDITLNTGTKEVVAIEIAAKDRNIGNWRLIHKEYKYDEDGIALLSDNVPFVYRFYNNEVGEGLPDGEVEREYDAVPQISACQELIEKNRIIDADYIEGFDNVDIDVILTTDKKKELSGQTVVYDSFYEKDIGWGTNLGFMYMFNCSVLDIPLLHGYTYSLNINAYDGNADMYTYTGNWGGQYPPEYINKRIISFANIFCSEIDTIETIVNKLIFQLRAGNGTTDCAIAFCYPGNGVGGYQLWGLGSQGTVPGGVANPSISLTQPNQLGIVISGTQQSPSQPYNSALISIELTCTKGDLKNKTFTSGANHPLGIIYYDRTGSRCGAVNTTKNTNIFIPQQSESTTYEIDRLYINYIKYEIIHTPPMGAEFWSFAYPKNTSVDYFIYGYIAKTDITKSVGFDNNTDCLQFVFNKNIKSTQGLFPKFNIQNYQWEKGDRVRFLFNEKGGKYYKFTQLLVGGVPTTPNLDFEIIGERSPGDATSYLLDDGGTAITGADGNKVFDHSEFKFIINSSTYLDTTVNNGNCVIDDGAIIQIYRPKKTMDTLLWYQFGAKHRVINPNTPQRYHEGGTDLDLISSVWQRNQNRTQSARGILWGGDAFVYKRLMGKYFPCESRWYSDFYDSEDYSIGKPNIANRDMKRTRYPSKLIYSGRKIQDTRVNDLSRVLSSDSFELPLKYGTIRYIKEIGFTLKILQDNKPSSLLIGRAGVTQPNEESTQIMSSTKEVLGTLLTPNSNFGTIHKTSAIRFQDNLFYFDARSKAIIRDAGNGAENLSKQYNIDGEIKTICDKFEQSGWDNVLVNSGYDERFNIAIFTFTDKVTPENSFTIGFRNERSEKEEGFTSRFSFIPDVYGWYKSTLTAFSGGKLWLHNDNELRNNFYGVQYKTIVRLLSNIKALIKKRFIRIFVTSNKKWSAPNAGDILIPTTGNNPVGMVSLLKEGSFSPVEGKFVADFGRNMTTTNLTPSISDLVDGQELSGEYVEIQLENSDTEEVKLFAININSIG